MSNPPNWNNKRPAQVSRDKVSNQARVSLKPDQFDNMIKQQGIRVKVYRTVLCPNVKSVDGAEHEIDCQVCKSSGFLDLAPIETWAYIQDQTLEKSMQSEGYVDHSSAKATFLAGTTLQYFTRVEVPDHFDTFFERIKRQAGQIDRLKYSAVQVNVLTDGLRQYYSGIDFDLDPNGDIKWTPGKGPESGTIYSIHYGIVLQYRAIQAVHVNRFAQTVSGNNVQFARLPECWVLQKIYLADRKDYRGNTLSPNIIRDSDDSST